MGVDHREGQRPGGDPGIGGLIQPAAELAPHDVDVEIEGERTHRHQSFGERGLA